MIIITEAKDEILSSYILIKIILKTFYLQMQQRMARRFCHVSYKKRKLGCCFLQQDSWILHRKKYIRQTFMVTKDPSGIQVLQWHTQHSNFFFAYDNNISDKVLMWHRHINNCLDLCDELYLQQLLVMLWVPVHMY